MKKYRALLLALILAFTVLINVSAFELDITEGADVVRELNPEATISPNAINDNFINANAIVTIEDGKLNVITPEEVEILSQYPDIDLNIVKYFENVDCVQGISNGALNYTELHGSFFLFNSVLFLLISQ